MAKPPLKTLLLSIIGLIAITVVIKNAIIPSIIDPVKKLEQASANRKKQINTLNKLKRTADQHSKRLAKLSTLGFANSSAEAIAKMGEHITQVIKQCKLNETEFSRRPFEPRAIVKNGPKPIGYTVSGIGSVKKNHRSFVFAAKRSTYPKSRKHLVITNKRQHKCTSKFSIHFISYWN